MRLARFLRFALMYLGRPPWDSGISPPELLAYLEAHPPGRAIDLGCGTGTNVITLARRGWQVTGVDFVPSAISAARRKLRAAGVTADVRVGDVTRLTGLSGPYDLALDLGCFHGLDVQGKKDYLARLSDLLGPGGHWLLYGFFTPVSPGLGITPADLRWVLERFQLLSRQDGQDRNGRASAYLLLQKRP